MTDKKEEKFLPMDFTDGVTYERWLDLRELERAYHRRAFVVFCMEEILNEMQQVQE